MQKQPKRTELHQAVMNSLEKLDANVDKLRTEDIPGLHTRMALLEVKLATLKEDVRAEAKRDAKIYGGVGSTVAGLFAIALTYFKH